MATTPMDRIRVVEFAPGGQIVERFVIQSGIDFTVTKTGLVRETLEFGPAERKQRMVPLGHRYGGSRYAGESHDNGTYKCQVLAAAVSGDLLLSKISSMLAELERVPGNLFIEHKMASATYPSYYEVRAPATWRVEYKALQANNPGDGSMVVDISWPVAPLVCGAPMDVLDEAIATNIADYTFDSSNPADFAAKANLGTERRLVHTARGYEYGSVQVTVKADPGSTLSGFKLGGAKRIAPDTYVEAYVDDNGTNSRLRIDTIIAGVRTNRFTTNLAARIVDGDNVYVRFRIENNVVYAEHWTQAAGPPTPMGAPTTNGSYTLTGGDATAAGQSVQGQGMGVYTPQHSGSDLGSIAIEPYVYRNVTLPAGKTHDGNTPGDAPALGSLDITTSGGSDHPKFALAWWTPQSDGVAGVYDSGSVAAATGLSSSADASALGGTVHQTASFAGSELIEWQVDLSTLVPDDETPDAALYEVWARLKLQAGLPSDLRVAAQFYCSGLSAATMSTLDRPQGQNIVIPSSGTVYRFHRLGVLRLHDLATVGRLLLRATGTPAAVTFGIDYAMLVPATRRALSPTGKSGNPTNGYPEFVPAVTQVRRVIASDLSGTIATTGSVAAPHTGLGGAQIEVPPAANASLGLKLSSRAPDDPSSSSGTEQLAHSATVHMGMIPRWHFQRPD